ncbi:MAG TPA: hypothetical protein VHL05_12380 [Terriglobales bacterium]|jgi:hypothetical protein|nr:hypothetical protein [Terriglobales bacterium]
MTRLACHGKSWDDTIVAIRAKGTPEYEHLRRLREAIGTAALAQRLGIPVPSLRRLFSTGVWSPHIENKVSALLEREAIEKEGNTVVPGYGPEKTERALGELRKLIANVAVEEQETRRTIKRAERLGEPVSPETRENLLKFQAQWGALRRAESNLSPESFEGIVARINNIEREAHGVARKFNVDARAVYTLFFSPGKFETVA